MWYSSEATSANHADFVILFEIDSIGDRRCLFRLDPLSRDRLMAVVTPH